MKFNYNLFSYTLCLLCAEILCSQSAHAVSCGAGQYPYLSWCHDCIDGCYCKGPGFYQGGGYLNSCDPANGTMKFGALPKSSGWNDVYTCPKDFPKSDGARKSEEDCYAQVGNGKLHNKSVKCDSGKYLPKLSEACSPCDKSTARRYCPGGTFHTSVSEDQGLTLCPSGSLPNESRTACDEQKEIKCDPGQYLPSGKNKCGKCSAKERYYCPGGSWTITKTASHDYGLKECPSGQIANNSKTGCVSSTIHCNPGQYLPGGKHITECSNCKGRYYICEGGTFTRGMSQAQGIRKCDGNLIANASHTACEAPQSSQASTVYCDPGQYLPSKANKCTSCKSGRYYVCEGGTFTAGVTYDQGIRQCSGVQANKEHTACEENNSEETQKSTQQKESKAITVPAGKYLPADKTSPATCKGSTNYCPGGEFEKASVDQGIIECPSNTRANKAKTACTATFTKIQMQYGPYGKDTPYTRQCWLKTDSADDFKSCVFGTKK